MTHIAAADHCTQRKIHNDTKLSFKWELVMLFVAIALFSNMPGIKLQYDDSPSKHNLNKLAWHGPMGD